MTNQTVQNMEDASKLLRYYILTSTTQAGSGHPTSSLSAVDLMTALFWGGYINTDLNKPRDPNNDKIIFSKGHAAPLLYSIYTALGALSEEKLMTLREFMSPIEGHPTMDWEYTECATGSLGQGLGVGLGMCLANRLDNNDSKVFVLLGDSEIAEGSIWEAMQTATHYKTDKLVAIVDINRLGQRGETMHGHDIKAIKNKLEAFGFDTHVVEDGNNTQECLSSFDQLDYTNGKPKAILAKTYKGAGISNIENKDNKHGKALTQDELSTALQELSIDTIEDLKVNVLSSIPDSISRPSVAQHVLYKSELAKISGVSEYEAGKKYATREGYGNALKRISKNEKVLALDAETSNSTLADRFKEQHPERFFEMFIAEQNMISTGMGMAQHGYIPFCSSFAAFLTRAYDQIRMLPYSKSNVKISGSHCGISIGPDGASQMALEDIAMMRSVEDMVVLYPSDAISTEKIVNEMANNHGNMYIRTTREKNVNIYKASEEFPIGGSKTLHKSDSDAVTVVAAGITLHETIKAHQKLKEQGINIRVIDLYSIKPLDTDTLNKTLVETGSLLVVEDHHKEGGIFSAINESITNTTRVVESLAVSVTPRSGTTEELLEYAKINSNAIIEKVLEMIK